MIEAGVMKKVVLSNHAASSNDFDFKKRYVHRSFRSIVVIRHQMSIT
jgi:hypothetical protein